MKKCQTKCPNYYAANPYHVKVWYYATKPKSLIKFLPILIILFPSSCRHWQKNNDSSKQDSFTTKFTTIGRSASIDTIGYYEIDHDSLIIPSFEIEVEPSQNADKKLKDDKETIIVKAIFTGKPKDTTSNEYIEKPWDREVFLTSHQIELTNIRIARFEGVKFSRAKYDSLADKDIRVFINIYSGRKSSQSNLLDGGVLQNKMSKVKGKRFPMKVKLIYDNN